MAICVFHRRTHPFPIVALVSILSATFRPSPAQAADIFVTPDAGAPAGDGSELLPFNSITAALIAAAPGDTVRLLPGVYYNEVDFDHGGTPGSPITLTHHAGRHSAVIEGTRGRLVVTAPEDCTIRIDTLPLAGGEAQSRIAIGKEAPSGVLEVRVALEASAGE